MTSASPAATPEPDHSSDAHTVHPHLVALDIDGTLLNFDLELSDRVKEAVAATRAAGHEVVIATGRQPGLTLPVVRDLGIDRGWAVSSNGAITLRLDPSIPDGWEIARAATFNPGRVMDLVRTELPGAVFAVEQPDGTLRLTAPFPDGELEAGLPVHEFDELTDGPATRVVVRSVEHTSEEFLHIVERLGLHGVSYAVGWTAWLDIAPDGVNKGSALEKVRQDLGIAPERTMAVGDGRNDLEMFDWAACSYAMGNAVEGVAEHADEVCPTVYDDGAAAVLEALLASPEYR